MTDNLPAIRSRAFEWLPKTVINEESSLYETKHWDYRMLSPEEATSLFLQSYREAFRLAYAYRTDYLQADEKEPLRSDTLAACKKTDFNGLWSARCHADRIGAQYLFYCSAAMTFAMERDWKYLPRPTQLYGKKAAPNEPSMLEYIVQRHREERRDYSLSDFYTIRKNFNHPLQRSYREFCLGKIKRSMVAKDLIASQFLERGNLEESHIADAVGEHVVRDAVQLLTLKGKSL